MANFLTVGEAADALGVTPRQLRYLGIGAITSVDGSRLYDADGLALVALYGRVAARFEAWGLPVWRARAALLYLEADIRAACLQRGAPVLVLDPWRGVVRVAASTSAPKTQTIAIRPVLAEMRARVAHTRTERPALWTGRAFTRAPELVAAV